MCGGSGRCSPAARDDGQGDYPNGLASSTGGGVVVSLQRGDGAKNRPRRGRGAYHRPKILPVAHTRNPVHATEASAPRVIANTDRIERFASTTSDDCCMTFDSALGPKSVDVVLMTTHTPPASHGLAVPIVQISPSFEDERERPPAAILGGPCPAAITSPDNY
jgi:hypothetical protein